LVFICQTCHEKEGVIIFSNFEGGEKLFLGRKKGRRGKEICQLTDKKKKEIVGVMGIGLQ